MKIHNKQQIFLVSVHQISSPLKAMHAKYCGSEFHDETRFYTMTTAGALSVTPVRTYVCLSNDVHSLSEILLIRIL